MEFINLSHYTATFLAGAYRFGVPSPKLQTLSEIFWALHIDYSHYEKTILGIFVYLFIYEVTMTKVNFHFWKECNQATNMSYFRMRNFCTKC